MGLDLIELADCIVIVMTACTKDNLEGEKLGEMLMEEKKMNERKPDRKCKRCGKPCYGHRCLKCQRTHTINTMSAARYARSRERQKNVKNRN